ncbi:MAG: glycoside hydrolase family 65 protein, partial [Bacteroidia bacterium]
MKNYIIHNEWSIIEEGLKPEYNLVSESLMSLGNGFMGLRGNFEETYTGPTLQGTYVGGVYYPDKTRVGWWKNGYPEYFAKVLNNVNWIGLHIKINDEVFDLNNCEVSNFRRELNMQEGILYRSFNAKLKNGVDIEVKTRRFCSIANSELGALQYEITPSVDTKIEVVSFLDFDIVNQDSNYDEKFWTEETRGKNGNDFGIVGKTKKTEFLVTAACNTEIKCNGQCFVEPLHEVSADKQIGQAYVVSPKAGNTVNITKTVSILSSLNHERTAILTDAFEVLSVATAKGFATLEQEQKDAWIAKWAECDIQIEGDVAAQQGIRFNIFQLYNTYTGEDERLNIGPKGFTGEKYGGSTYWDTEAYCLPFYLATAEPSIARQLLVYRHNHLQKAIENAEKLGFTCGAALYPMVTINGEECHNEWEITFEEIHRNGAIAHAIYNYVNYTGDKGYLAEYGLDVLIGIARFWAQRVNWSTNHEKYVMLGVTGPNEFENNVNNNWYTNYLANWCMRYCIESLDYAKENHSDKYDDILSKSDFAEAET